MSLNPVSYLQTWEHNLAAARHRYQSLYAESESDVQDETYHDLPESLSSSASFLSRFSQNSFGHRLNIYPYTGDDVTHVRSNEISPVRGIDSADIKAGDEEERTLSKTRGAYEVSCRKRIGMPLDSVHIRMLTISSASAHRTNLLLSLLRNHIRVCGTQTHLDSRRRISQPMFGRRTSRENCLLPSRASVCPI